jgi:hypothetical protein
MIEASAAMVDAPSILLETIKTKDSKMEQQPKLQNPPTELELSKIALIPVITPKKGRRMANVLDAVLRPSKAAMPTPTKITKDKSEELKKATDKSIAPDCVKARPSKCRPPEQVSGSIPGKISLPIPEAGLGNLEFIIRHASGKHLTKEQIAKVQHYAKI